MLDLKKEIGKLVAKYPTRVAGPKYIHQNKPCCIFGHVLIKYFNIKELDYRLPIEELLPKLGIEVSPEDKLFYKTLQEEQDLGKTWLDSFKKAERKAYGK